MTSAIVITIFASFLWATTNHIDKFMITTIDETGGSIKTLLIFSTFIAGLIFTPTWLILSGFSVPISILSLSCTLLASITYILATYLYFIVLNKNDASIVVIMFQLIPVFSYFISLILFKENLTIRQIIGSIIIIISAVLISFDFGKKNDKKSLKH